jgi:hypothetical protein
MKIGITERGDAAIDLSWEGKLNQIAGVVLITKNCGSKPFLQAVARNKDRVIVHTTITGNGASFIEPNVPHPEEALKGLWELASIMDPKRIVLRIDPIIPNQAGRSWIPYLISKLPQGVRRVRFSIIDNYKHVGQRGLHLPWQGFHAPEHLVADVVNDFMPHSNHLSIESCGENYAVIPDEWKIGCISEIDLKLLGIVYNPNSLSIGKQRASCRCLSVKQELLTKRAKCPHGCLYCYWKG